MNHVDKFILAHRRDAMNTEPQTPRTQINRGTVSQNILGEQYFTPDETGHYVPVGEYAYLERELSTANARIAELEQVLTGRTVSCAACNETAVERDRWRECAKNLASDLRSIQFIIQDNENIFGVVTIGNAALAKYTCCAESTATTTK